MWIGIATLSIGLVIIGLADAIFIGIDADANGIISGQLSYLSSFSFHR